MVLRIKILTGILPFAAMTALGYGNWLALGESIDVSPAMPSAVASNTNSNLSVADAQLHVVTLADLKETLTRPLFYVKRRPLVLRQAEQIAGTPVVPAPPTAVTVPNANLRLLGLMRGGEAGQRVLIQTDNGPAAQWQTIGAEIGGWRLTNIEADHVIIESSGTRSVLTLHPEAAPSRSAQ